MTRFSWYSGKWIFLFSFFIYSVAYLRAASYSISPDDPTSLQRGVDAAYQSGLKKITIPPGVYRLTCASNATWHLRFSDMKNFEIDASGVTLVLTERTKRAVNFNECENVTFRGATLLREVPPFSQGKIESLAEDLGSVTIRVDKGYPTDIDDKRFFPRIPVITAYEAGSQKLKPLVNDYYVAKIERLGANLFRFYGRAKLDPRIPLVVGDHVAWRGPSGADLSLWSSSKMTIEDVTIKNGTGIGFMELCGEGDNRYSRCLITYADKPVGAIEEPLTACATDGFHSASMRRGPTLENCRFEGLNDDQVNIHGSYGMLVEIKNDGKKVIIDWRTPHSGARTPFTFARVGDRLRFYNTQGALQTEAKVLAIKPISDVKENLIGQINSRTFSDRSKAFYWEVTLGEKVMGEPKGMVANTELTGSGFVLRGNVFKNNRGHGIFIRASDGLIENNTIEGTMMAGILIAPEMNSWNESDYVQNLIIRSNTLRNVGVATQPWNSGLTVAAFEYGGFVPLPGGHRNIVIENNLFENNRSANLVITSAIGVEIKNNHFVSPMKEPPFRVETIGTSTDSSLIWMRFVDKIKLSGNEIFSPGEYFKTKIDVDVAKNIDGLENGIILKP
jgi:parallel beta-helix repeat protein